MKTDKLMYLIPFFSVRQFSVGLIIFGYVSHIPTQLFFYTQKYKAIFIALVANYHEFNDSRYESPLF